MHNASQKLDEFELTRDRIPTHFTNKNLPDMSQISIPDSDTNGVIPFRRGVFRITNHWQERVES